MKVLKVIGIILLVILGVVAVVSVIVAIIANKNVKAMNDCIDDTIALVSKDHKVTEIPAGEYQEMKAKGVMKFRVKQYDIEDVGNLSVMTLNIGMMQMSSCVFTPLDKNIPLMSCDYMYILNNRKAYLEIYDLVAEKDAKYTGWLEKFEAVGAAYSELDDIEVSKTWYEYLLTVATYKAGKPADDETLKNLMHDTVQVYLDMADDHEVMDADAKAEKLDIIKKYSDRLIDEGGISTDFFKNTFGADFTRDFFDKVFFGTKRK